MLNRSSIALTLASTLLFSGLCQAQSCSQEVLVEQAGGGGMVNILGYRITGTTPLQLEEVYGTRFPNDGLPGAGRTDWRRQQVQLTDVPGILESARKRLRHYEQNCRADLNAQLCQLTIENERRVVDWLQCVASRADGVRTAGESGDLDVVTPQVAGCPRYLRKSMVVWRSAGHGNGNTWEIRNVSNRTVKVTFRDSGGNSSPDTLPPGQSTQVGLTSSQVPPYVVRDADELFRFNRTNGANGAVLKCDLAIRPR